VLAALFHIWNAYIRLPIYTPAFWINSFQALTDEGQPKFKGASDVQPPVFADHRWRSLREEPDRHGADDAQPRDRQPSQQPDGQLLRAARQRRPDHHRRRLARPERARLSAHAWPLHG